MQIKYTVEVLPDLEIIKVSVNEALNLFEKKEAYVQGIDELCKNGYHRLLFDIRKVEESRDFTISAVIDIFNHVRELKLCRGVKSAFLSKDQKGQHKVFGVFLKIITKMDMNHFISYNEAVKWLGED